MSLIDKIESKKRLILQETGALMEGHFRLSSGLHSQYYFQCARLLQYPMYSEQIARYITPHLQCHDIGAVISPAIGAITFGYEIARVLKCRAIFAERVDGVMMLRRGFELIPGEQVIVAEDVTTTGGSALEIKDLAVSAGAQVKGFCAIVDRSKGSFQPEQPFAKWLTLDLETYKPEDCPLCKQNIPLIYPGSRKTAEPKQ